jgi:phenolic acid decarboxylase
MTRQIATVSIALQHMCSDGYTSKILFVQNQAVSYLGLPALYSGYGDQVVDTFAALNVQLKTGINNDKKINSSPSTLLFSAAC